MTADPLIDRLPIIIGVTGHRDLDLRPDYDGILRERVDAIFARFERDFPATPLLMLSPLAEGADRLVAEVAARRNIAVRVPLPMPLDRYRATFTDDRSRAAFDEFLQARGTMAYTVCADASDDESYALLGSHLVRSCHVLIALWNGLPSAAIGGTAQIVRFRVFGVPPRFLPSQTVIDEPEVGAVYQVYAARTSEPATERPVGTCVLRVRREGEADAVGFEAIDALPDGSADPFELLFRRIEDFNRDCVAVPGSAAPAESESATWRLMQTAERLATFYQRKARSALVRLFAATAIAALFFQLYATFFGDVHALVAPYVAALVAAVVIYRRADRGRWQDRAQDYRALELGLNVQHVWDAAGLGESVADYYIARQRTELDWIPKAIAAAHTVDRRLPFDDARGFAAVRAFVQEQFAYFAGSSGSNGAAAREERRSRRFESLRAWAVRSGFFLSGLLIFSAFAAAVRPAVYGGNAREELWHTGIILGIGLAAVAAALLNDYLERRGFYEHARRYELMAGLYRRALAALDSDGASAAPVYRAIIAQVGHEALAENGDWVLMHRELPIELLQIG